MWLAPEPPVLAHQLGIHALPLLCLQEAQHVTLPAGGPAGQRLARVECCVPVRCGRA
jgi:hypothetical protein